MSVDEEQDKGGKKKPLWMVSAHGEHGSQEVWMDDDEEGSRIPSRIKTKKWAAGRIWASEFCLDAVTLMSGRFGGNLIADRLRIIA